MKPRHLILTLLLLAFSTYADELKTFDLQHRSTDEMIPILQPLVSPNGAISGTGYTLIIRSDRANLQQLEQAIKRLDQAPKMLRITVDRSGENQRNSEGASVSGRLDQPNVRIHSGQQHQNQNGSQQLQVMEGHWATIRRGRSIPHVVQQYRQPPGGTRIERHTEYRDVDSGFEVRPRINGQRVTLEVRPFRATPSTGGRVEQESIITTVSGRVGEWITLGGVNESQSSSGSGTIYYKRGSEQVNSKVRIKVTTVSP
ncbi:MAG: hypothetical protein R6X15_02630 [Pseudomonadota bacterium]